MVQQFHSLASIQQKHIIIFTKRCVKMSVKVQFVIVPHPNQVFINGMMGKRVIVYSHSGMLLCRMRTNVL